jgi:endonuclease/exonuclease/phosphatase family metal-dependent hydrolase
MKINSERKNSLQGEFVMFETLITDLRAHGYRWLLTALVTVFGMQILRVLFVGFVGYLRDSQGMASLSLAPIAIAIFALSFLAAPLNRIAGTHRALWITAGGLAVIRVAEQFSQTAAFDLYLSIAGTALFLMFIPIAVGVARSQGVDANLHLGFGFLLGLSIDAAIQIGARTLDLSWQPGLLKLVEVLAIAIGLLLCLREETSAPLKSEDAPWIPSLNLLAIGPFIFIQLLIFQNVAAFSSLTGLETPAAGALLIAGNVVGLALSARAGQLSQRPLYVLFAGLLVIVPIYLAFSVPSFLAALWLLLGQAFSFALGILIFQGSSSGKASKGFFRLSMTNGFSAIFLVLLLFVYYATYDIDFGFRNSALRIASVLLITVFVALGHVGKSSAKTSQPTYSPAVLAAMMLLVPLYLMLVWKPVSAQIAEPGTTSVRVMDYNLHDAANTDGRVDPEELARQIETSRADIVGLQEVSRGWLVWGGMDMLTWLSQRLDMPYVWGPTADEQWGNAILSRYPIKDVEFYKLPPEDVLLLRGYIWAEIDIDGFILTIVDTHFSEKDDQDFIRATQSSEILATWNGHPATVIMGDFNALPDSQAITLMLEAGLVDISREIGDQPSYTYYSANPDHQIDYIFVTPDLGYSDFIIPDTQASDHLPLTVTIELTQ